MIKLDKETKNIVDQALADAIEEHKEEIFQIVKSKFQDLTEEELTALVKIIVGRAVK